MFAEEFKRKKSIFLKRLRVIYRLQRRRGRELFRCDFLLGNYRFFDRTPLKRNLSSFFCQKMKFHFRSGVNPIKL